MKGKKFYTIGHSTRSIDEFIAILLHYKIEALVDVRSLPGSERLPHFNKENLAPVLEENGISYIHLKELGGLRHTTKDSINKAWHNKSFRGYADYMQTTEFKDGLKTLIGIVDRARTAIMCAEVLPWRCHRSLIGDAMIIRAYEPIDIFSMKKVKRKS